MSLTGDQYIGFICSEGKETMCSFDTPTGVSTALVLDAILTVPPLLVRVDRRDTGLTWSFSVASSWLEGLADEGGGSARDSGPSPPALTKGLPEIPSSGAGGRLGAGAGLGNAFSCWEAEDMAGRWGRLSIDAERLPGEFEINDDARPLDEVERPGRTKASDLGEEVGTAGAIRVGMAMGIGRSLPMAAMTLSTTYSWLRFRCFRLVTSQKASLNKVEASISSSWQHTGVAALAKESTGCSRAKQDWFSRSCLSLCFRTRTSIMPWSVSEFAVASEGERLLLAREARWEARWAADAKLSQALSRELLSAWEKGRRAALEALFSEEAGTVAVDKGSSIGMRLW